MSELCVYGMPPADLAAVTAVVNQRYQLDRPGVSIDVREAAIRDGMQVLGEARAVVNAMYPTEQAVSGAHADNRGVIL